MELNYLLYFTYLDKLLHSMNETLIFQFLVAEVAPFKLNVKVESLSDMEVSIYTRKIDN